MKGDPVIIFEGPNYVGKTTVMQTIINLAMKAKKERFVLYVDDNKPKNMYTLSTFEAFSMYNEPMFYVQDRCFISDIVYTPVFNAEAMTNEEFIRKAITKLNEYKAKIIVMLPSIKDLKKFWKYRPHRTAPNRPETYEEWINIVNRYKNLGNMGLNDIHYYYFDYSENYAKDGADFGKRIYDEVRNER